MAIQLTMAATQQPVSSSNNVPAYQDWNSSPQTPADFVYNMGGASIANFEINLYVRDSLNSPEQLEYSEFRLRAMADIPPGQLQWMGIFSGDLNYGGTVPITTNAWMVKSLVQFENLHLLQAGQYQREIVYTIEGFDGLSWTPIWSYTYVVNLQVVNSLAFTVNPTEINFYHVQGSALPSQTITVTGQAWELVSGSNIVLTSDTPGVSIVPQGSGFKATGTGIAEITVSLSAFYDSPQALSATINYITGQGSGELANVDIYTTIVPAGSFLVSPSSLNFLGIQGLLEPASQQVQVLSQYPLTFSHTDWLIVTLVPNPGNQTQFLYSVQPIATVNMSPGIYSGFITFAAVIGGNTVTQTVTVQYELQGFVSTPYNSEDFAFTLENEELHFSTVNAETYFDMLLSVKSYSFFENIESSRLLTYKIPLFQNRSKMNIGRIVHRLMAQLPGLDLSKSAQYKVALVDYTVRELNEAGEVLRENILQNIKFVAGLRPENFSGNKAVLQLHEHPLRITPRSRGVINMLLPFGNYDAEVLVNGVQKAVEVQGFLSTNIYTRHLLFSDYQVKPGDLVEYKIWTDGAGSDGQNFVSKKYLCFPEGERSTMIFWEASNNLLNCLEFTGRYKGPADIENTTHDHRRALADLLEKIDSGIVEKFAIGTGWILDTDTMTIESLLRSKRAWILREDGSITNLVPIQKAFPKVDSERQLISYDVEFQINRANNAQIYMS